MKKLKNIIWAFAMTVFALSSCDIVEEPYKKGAEDEKAIIRFAVDSIEGVIDELSKSVTLDFPGGTDVTHLAPTIVVSDYATVVPASGEEQDFTMPVIYTVTAFNGTTAQYQVMAFVHDTENEKSILSFVIEEPFVEGIIDEAAKTVTLKFPVGTDVSNLTPIIIVSEGATIEPASGMTQDFTEPVNYTVTALNGTSMVYVVSAIVEDPNQPIIKKVLLEDFTGVRCVNCPAAGELALQLQETYPQLIVLGVHAGMLSMPNGGYPDFRTPEGTEWWNFFGFDANPIGTVDRVLSGTGRYGLNPADWATFIVDEIAKDPVIALKIENTYNADNRTLNVTVSGKVLIDQLDDLNLVVCLMEDGITGLQQTPDGVNPDYVHRHVFRGTLDGLAWGLSIGTAPFAEGFTFEKTYSYTLPEDFEAENCAVVAYVCQDSDKTVLQVEEAEVIE